MASDVVARLLFKGAVSGQSVLLAGVCVYITSVMLLLVLNFVKANIAILLKRSIK